MISWGPLVTWPFDPTVYAGLLVLFFGHAWLARRSSDVQRKHTVYFLGALAALWIALETPIDTLSDHYLDSVHMLQHVLLAFIAPPLLLLGLSREMAAWVARLPGVRPLTEPVQAQVIAAVVMVAWHAPALYDATLRNEGFHVVEHVMFIASGVALFWPLIHATATDSRLQISSGPTPVPIPLAPPPQGVPSGEAGGATPGGDPPHCSGPGHGADRKPRDAGRRRRHARPPDNGVRAGQHRLAVDRAGDRAARHHAHVVQHRQVDGHRRTRHAGEKRGELEAGH